MGGLRRGRQCGVSHKTHTCHTRRTTARTHILEGIADVHELPYDKRLAGVSRPNERDGEAVIERALLERCLQSGRVGRCPEHAVARERYDLVLRVLHIESVWKK